MNVMGFAKTAFYNLFHKPATESYPFVPREYSERTRGHVILDLNSCIFCGLCSRKCPTGAITVDRASKTWSIKRFSCIQCGSCVEGCVKHSLSMGQSYTTPAAQKSVDIYTAPVEDASTPTPKVKGENDNA